MRWISLSRSTRAIRTAPPYIRLAWNAAFMFLRMLSVKSTPPTRRWVIPSTVVQKNMVMMKISAAAGNTMSKMRRLPIVGTAKPEIFESLRDFSFGVRLVPNSPVDVGVDPPEQRLGRSAERRLLLARRPEIVEGVDLLLEKAVTFLDRVEILRKGLEGLAVERMRRTRPELPEGIPSASSPVPNDGKACSAEPAGLGEGWRGGIPTGCSAGWRAVRSAHI